MWPPMAWHPTHIFMSTHQPEQATTEPMELDLPEAVAETLYELATRESLELSMAYCIGECKLPDGELLVSTSMDTAFGSIGFVDDGRGVRWVTWQDYADSRQGHDI